MEKKYQIRIPRVSLSSSGSSNRSCQQTNSSKTTDLESGESEPEAVCSRGYSQRAEMYTVRKAPKIGGSISTSSTSASSSATSNRSNYSLSSFLLSVKNLDHHRSSAETSHQSCCETTSKYILSENNPNVILKSNFHNNCKLQQQQPTSVDNEAANKYPIYEQRWKMLQNIKNIAASSSLPALSIKREHQQEKEVDEISTTSTKTNTNFTVVSMNDSEDRLTKGKAICRRSHQLTILIFIMTLIFIFVISFMLILMDMRNAKMPR